MNNFIFKTNIENHDKIKKTLLDQINLIPNNPIHTEKCKLYHTDWNLPVDMHREYRFIFFEAVKKHLDNMASQLGAPNVEIDNFWFQQYTESGAHSWHTHVGVDFSNVYFLECSEGFSTQFKNFEVDCKEGDILSFPAFLPHKSPTIQKGDRKTIIAFNTNVLFPG